MMMQALMTKKRISKKIKSLQLQRVTYPVTDLVGIKAKMLNWAKRFNIFCYLDNQQYSNEGYECLLAVNAIKFIDDTINFDKIDDFLSKETWSFGHLSYSLKDCAVKFIRTF